MVYCMVREPGDREQEGEGEGGGDAGHVNTKRACTHTQRVA